MNMIFMMPWLTVNKASLGPTPVATAPFGSVGEICSTLKISRATYYRFLKIGE